METRSSCLVLLGEHTGNGATPRWVLTVGVREGTLVPRVRTGCMRGKGRSNSSPPLGSPLQQGLGRRLSHPNFGKPRGWGLLVPSPLGAPFAHAMEVTWVTKFACTPLVGGVDFSHPRSHHFGRCSVEERRCPF